MRHRQTGRHHARINAIPKPMFSFDDEQSSTRSDFGSDIKCILEICISIPFLAGRRVDTALGRAGRGRRSVLRKWDALAEWTTYLFRNNNNNKMKSRCVAIVTLRHLRPPHGVHAYGQKIKWKMIAFVWSLNGIAGCCSRIEFLFRLFSQLGLFAILGKIFSLFCLHTFSPSPPSLYLPLALDDISHSRSCFLFPSRSCWTSQSTHCSFGVCTNFKYILLSFLCRLDRPYVQFMPTKNSPYHFWDGRLFSLLFAIEIESNSAAKPFSEILQNFAVFCAIRSAYWFTTERVGASVSATAALSQLVRCTYLILFH